MIHLIVLLIAVFVMTVWALVTHEGEIFAPSVLMCIGFFISVVAAMMNAAQWDLPDIRWITVAVIAGGVFIFVFVDMLVHMTAKSFMLKRLGHSWRGLDSEEAREIQIRRIDCSRVMIILLSLMIIVIAFFYVRFVFVIVRASDRSADNWRELMSQFRLLHSYRQSDMRMPFVIEQSHQMVNILGYVVVYLFIYDYVFQNHTNMGLLILAFLITMDSFLSASRMTMLQYLLGVIVTYDFFMYWKCGSGIKCKLSLLIKLMLAFLAGCIAFSALRYFAGRMNDSDTVSYIAFYLGQSIHNLNLFLQDTRTEPQLWGKETFSALHHIVYYLTGDQQFYYMDHKEFRFLQGINMGNVYTVFRSFINDFGYPGMIVLTIICSLTCNMAYHSIRSIIWKRKRIGYYLSILYYMLFISGIFFAFFAEFYFTRLGLSLITKYLLGFWGGELALARLKFGKFYKGGDDYGAVAVGYRPGI